MLLCKVNKCIIIVVIVQINTLINSIWHNIEQQIGVAIFAVESKALFV
jgi:hypothetical protein